MDAFVKLAVAEGCGPGLVAALLDPDSDPEVLLRDPPRLPPAVRRRLLDPDLAAHAARWRAAAHAAGQTVLTPDDVRYPGRLRCAPQRPNALFARGALDLLDGARPAVAVVGSRTPTPYGVAAAEDFAAHLGRAGFVLWSGLAIGIDAVAHRTALTTGSPTVAVLAGGLDRVYPPAHEPLAQRIAVQGGLLLGETPPGTRAQRGHFPRRNRLLAACDAVLVVEAGLSSGTLHTARHAADAGVDVFAVPGPYGSPRSQGCHALIADGAQIAADPADLLRRLGANAALRGDAAPEAALGADAAAILDALRSGPRPVDLVQRETKLARGPFLAALDAAVGAGLVRDVPGDLLQRVSPALRADG